MSEKRKWRFFLLLRSLATLMFLLALLSELLSLSPYSFTVLVLAFLVLAASTILVPVPGT